MEYIPHLVIAIIVFVLSIVFRNEIKKLVSWIVSFKKVTKSEKGFSLEGYPEIKDKQLESDKLELITDGADSIKINEEENTLGYWELYIADKHEESLKALEGLIKDTDDIDKIIKLKCQKCLILFFIDRKEANKLYNSLIKQFPDNYLPYDYYARACYWSGNNDDCLKILEEGLKIVKNKSQLLTVKSNCLITMGKISEAKETLIKSIEQQNDVPFHYEKLCKLYEDEPKKAYERYKEGMKKYPDNNELRYNFASFLEKQEYYGEALLHYNELCSKNPENISYLAYKGNNYLMLGLYDKALESYIKANNLAKGSKDWIVANIGNIYNNRGFYTKAISYLNQAIKLNPDSEYSHDRIASAIKFTKKEEEKELEILASARKKDTFKITD